MKIKHVSAEVLLEYFALKIPIKSAKLWNGANENTVNAYFVMGSRLHMTSGNR